MKKRNFLTQAGKVLIQFTWQILTVVAAIGWIFLLISAFSDRISPLNYPYLPFFGLFFPVILLFNILFLCFWLLFRKWKQFLITLAVLLICGGAIHIYFPIRGKTKEIPDGCIKVMTYNVMSLGYIQTHTKQKPNPILQYVAEEDPDIVCFQEYDPFWLKDEAIIRNALKAMPYTSSRQGDLMVFSKYPISSVRRLPIESDYNSACIMELDIHGRKVTLINNHLESNKIAADERTGYYDLTKDPDKQKLENFTHMMFQRLMPAFRMRAKQAQVVSNTIREHPNPYIIVCGDFNDTPISYARRTIKGDLEDAFVESGSGMGISFNRYRFLFRIDYILHSNNMKAYNCTVGKLKTSDHYPVYTYLQFLD
ncbi:MAG: endonuclease/exonuclease/phosphatase family protein [Dysgonamonadaceae bacterium]|jgi:endonuclease/exonuclease/phosphatase family metal-dependent hydrolase|nr:endonuclease/exonuclease/phosphatase family protein [Dysgonamonadaceae bacterium]